MENNHHAVLQEPIFHLSVQELPETVYLDRKYVFDNLVSLKPNYGKDTKVLLWLQRVLRTNSFKVGEDPIDLLMVRDFFLLDDWWEFQRFKQFVKSMRIIDAQARNYLTRHCQEFHTIANNPKDIERILDSLETIVQWLGSENYNKKNRSLELVAKTYGKNLSYIRASALLPEMLLNRDPNIRYNIFHLMSSVADPVNGSSALFGFLGALGAATHDEETSINTTDIKSDRDFQRALAALRKYLLSSKVPA
jgi:hypothetical protein